MAGDWIRLNRRSLDSRVFSDPFLWQLWCWCLLRANWKSGWKHGRTIKPGQFVTGRDNAAEQLNCSGSKWYRGMKTLQEWSQIKLETNNRSTLVTILNWSVYQGVEDPPRTTDEQPVNNQWTTDEQPVNTIEEGKERKKVKKGKNIGGSAQKKPKPRKIFTPPAINEVAAYCAERGNAVDASRFVDYYQAQDWRLANGRKMADWKAAIRSTWERNSRGASAPALDPRGNMALIQGMIEGGEFDEPS